MGTSAHSGVYTVDVNKLPAHLNLKIFNDRPSSLLLLLEFTCAVDSVVRPCSHLGWARIPRKTSSTDLPANFRCT